MANYIQENRQNNTQGVTYYDYLNKSLEENRMSNFEQSSRADNGMGHIGYYSKAQLSMKSWVRSFKVFGLIAALTISLYIMLSLFGMNLSGNAVFMGLIFAASGVFMMYRPYHYGTLKGYYHPERYTKEGSV